MSSFVAPPLKPHQGCDAYRASILHFTGDPAIDDKTVHWYDDGVLVVQDGRIVVAGDWESLRASLSSATTLHDWRGKLIVPGFIDTHIHYPQTDIVASPAPGLLPWLETYTYPAEGAFSDSAHASEVAHFFVNELLRCGTTTAAVYGTVHPQSVEAFFIESASRNLRMIAGKVLMDRHSPEQLRDNAIGGIADSEKLLSRWHKTGRQLYAITPRFAPASSREQLQLAGELARRYPDVYVQSHVAENHDEVQWAQSLFPDARSYLDIYDRYDLLRPRAVYAHGIWLDDADMRRIAETGSALAICPTSNLFLGSGLFPFKKADWHCCRLSIGTDIGAGTSFSMLQTMNELYKVARMGSVHLSGHRMFYLATLGGARALHLEGTIGNFAPGCEADFVVLNPVATPLMARRLSRTENLEEKLFALAMLGDDRAITATYAAGVKLYSQQESR